MRTPIIAAILLVLAVPAFAAGKRTVSPAQWQEIHNYAEASLQCINHRTGSEDGESAEIAKYCADADKMGKKLHANGFCFYAKSGVGRPSKDGKHCYTMHDPSIPSRFHQN